MGSASNQYGAEMMQRLGNVLYWLGCILAASLAILGIAFGVIMALSTNSSDQAAGPWIGLGIVASGFALWLVGAACRYVLSGK